MKKRITTPVLISVEPGIASTSEWKMCVNSRSSSWYCKRLSSALENRSEQSNETSSATRPSKDHRGSGRKNVTSRRNRWNQTVAPFYVGNFVALIRTSEGGRPACECERVCVLSGRSVLWNRKLTIWPNYETIYCHSPACCSELSVW